MLSSERQSIILQQIEQLGHVSVKGLKELLHVSLDTVRRDLEVLERQQKLKRVHGGAVQIEEETAIQTFKKRTVTNQQKKAQLAKTAMCLIKEHQAIALNAGTTNIELAKQLVEHFDRLTVITNSLKIAEILSAKHNFTIIIPGGILNVEELSLYGRSFEKELSQFNIDCSFISVNAVSIEKGLTDFRLGESEVINAMLHCAVKKVVVADSSKFETVSYINIAPLDKIDLIVTDDEITNDLAQVYKENDIQIMFKC